MLSIFKERPAIVAYIFSSALLSGLVLIGICSSFALMLTETGLDTSSITQILLATIPYSWKFILSPFVKEIFTKYKNSKIDVIKFISYISQFCIFLGFSSLGYFHGGNLTRAFYVICLIVLFTSVHDIVREHIKLSLFEQKDLGIVTAIENTGFRFGMFVSGVVIVYAANTWNWKVAFFSAAFVVLGTTVSTFFIKNYKEAYAFEHDNSKHIFKNYIYKCYDFFISNKIFIILVILISLKLSDITINILKPMFIHFLGVNRIEYANMVHLYGALTMSLGGIVAGLALSKISMVKCIRFTLISQIANCLFFVYLSVSKNNLLWITILINCASFIFSFSNVVFRTLVALISNRDVNIFTLLLSLGSLIRICAYSFSGKLVDNFSWEFVYLLCLLSNIPGYLLCRRLICK